MIMLYKKFHRFLVASLTRNDKSILSFRILDEGEVRNLIFSSRGGSSVRGRSASGVTSGRQYIVLLPDTTVSSIFGQKATFLLSGN